MGPCLSPRAPVRANPLGHQPGTLFGLERAFPKGYILDSNGPFWCQETVLAPGANSTQKAHLYRKARFFSVGAFQFQKALLSFRGS